jgi:F-type H+-transporting ATPase subunit a
MPVTPFASDVLFRLGPVPITRVVVTTWGIIAVLGGGAYLATRRLRVDAPGRLQSVLEIVVETISNQICHTLRAPPERFVPLLGTLFLFLAFANLSAIVPGVDPPTAHIETPAALAVIVLISTHVFGVRVRGLRAHLAEYVEPNPLLLPLNLLAELTRTFSLAVRLFGNVMSHELVLGIVLALAGLLVPIPLMVLGILIGLVQAYIFSILATVFVGAAIAVREPKEKPP